MRRSIGILFVVLTCPVGLGAIARAQDATPIANASPIACATPVATEDAASPVASPVSTVGSCPALVITIQLTEMAYQPNDITIPANTPVLFILHNAGLTLHTFTIDPLHITTELVPKATRTLIIDAPAGDYQFYCYIPGHREAGMVGVLHVR
jgi:uncharacterized cupredoxin-like copper-binding protein